MKVCETSDRLKQIIAERGLKQTDILKLVEPLTSIYNVKLPKSALSQYINGIYKPDSEKVMILSKALNVSPVWLMGYDVDMNPDTEENVSRDEFINELKDILVNKELTEEQKKYIKNIIKSIID